MDNRDLAIKAELIKTTGTIGWQYILQLAEKIVQEKEKTALSEMVETKIVALQRKAQASREFLRDLVHQIEKAKQVEKPEPGQSLVETDSDQAPVEQEFDQPFVEVAYE